MHDNDAKPSEKILLKWLFFSKQGEYLGTTTQTFKSREFQLFINPWSVFSIGIFMNFIDISMVYKSNHLFFFSLTFQYDIFVTTYEIHIFTRNIRVDHRKTRASIYKYCARCENEPVFMFAND